MIQWYSVLFVFAWFSGCITTRGNRRQYTKHPYVIRVYCTIRLNGCLRGCFTPSKTLDCTSQGEYNHPRVSNDRAQSTAILGSGERVGDHRHFTRLCVYARSILETVRRRADTNSLHMWAAYPTQGVKKPPPNEGWRLVGVIHQHLQGARFFISSADI